jgi:hypothetical protein
MLVHGVHLMCHCAWPVNALKGSCIAGQTAIVVATVGSPYRHL